MTVQAASAHRAPSTCLQQASIESWLVSPIVRGESCISASASPSGGPGCALGSISECIVCTRAATFLRGRAQPAACSQVRTSATAGPIAAFCDMKCFSLTVAACSQASAPGSMAAGGCLLLALALLACVQSQSLAPTPGPAPAEAPTPTAQIFQHSAPPLDDLGDQVHSLVCVRHELTPTAPSSLHAQDIPLHPGLRHSRPLPSFHGPVAVPGLAPGAAPPLGSPATRRLLQHTPSSNHSRAPPAAPRHSASKTPAPAPAVASQSTSVTDAAPSLAGYLTTVAALPPPAPVYGSSNGSVAASDLEADLLIAALSQVRIFAALPCAP